MNVSDSERVSTLLESDGFEITDTEESADIILLNTCSVREKAEHKLYTRIGQIRKTSDSGKMVGVMGCVAQLEGEKLFEGGRGVDFVVGTQAVGRVSKAIRSRLCRRKEITDLKGREDDYDWLPLRPAAISVCRVRTDNRGLQQVLHILHCPVFERPGKEPAGIRDHPPGSGTARRGRKGGPSDRTERQQLQARQRRRARGFQGSHPILEAAPGGCRDRDRTHQIHDIFSERFS